jgi:hypothetical protein
VSVAENSQELVVVRKHARLPWIFVDGATQQTFRIRIDSPAWEPTVDTNDAGEALCGFHITADDGRAFAFELQISGDVLDENEVADLSALLSLIQGKGVEIIEGAIHKGIRGDQQLVWETDGVSVVG